MGYTKKWIPPTSPLRNDLTAWKTLFQDLHDNLILAGLVQTSTPGQLVIADVSELPADNSYAGFIEYAFDDALQATAPIVIKLEYGCGQEGLATGEAGSPRRNRTPRIRSTVTFNGMQSSSYGHPQLYHLATGDAYGAQTTLGMSSVCYNESAGFFGIVYGAGSRNKPIANNAGGYHGASLTMLVQRSVNSAGIPSGDGLCIYAPGYDVGYGVSNSWTDAVMPAAYSQYIDAVTGAQPAHRNLAMRVGGNQNSIIEGEIQTQQVFASTPKLKPWPTIFSYNHGDIPEGTEFELEVFPGNPQNFLALGRETGLSVDPIVGQRAGIAMLFE